MDVAGLRPDQILPMEARSAERLPADPGHWQYEPKWDGFRCLAWRAGAEVELRAKSGKPLSRYFPEMAEVLGKLRAANFVIDGELMVLIDGKADFEALQMRLHPAESRVRKLAAETPASFMLFDMLVSPGGRLLVQEPLEKRREALETFVRAARQPGLRLSPFTREPEKAAAWLEAAGGDIDGVVAKPLGAPYMPGERAMIKVKRLRSADCVVGGFRYLSGKSLVGSLLLGLYDKEGKLHHVGFTSTIPDVERPALTKRLEALRRPPGFTGRAPGGPSRWNSERSGEWEALKPELVVEVRFDHVTGGRFRHGTRLLRWRPDKEPRQCTMDQIAPAGR